MALLVVDSAAKLLVSRSEGVRPEPKKLPPGLLQKGAYGEKFPQERSTSVSLIRSNRLPGIFCIMVAALTAVCMRAETPPAYAVEVFGGDQARQSFAASGLRATEALFPILTSLCADRNGNVYFVANQAHRVYRLRPDGSFETIAGTGSSGVPISNRPATQVNVGFPVSVFVDAAGNVYIATSTRIMKVTPDGMLQVIGGGGQSGNTGEGQVATSAALNSIVAVIADAAGNVYFADNQRYRVARIAAGTGILTTIAGGASSLSDTGDGGPATAARFTAIRDLAIDSAGALYVATQGGGVRKFTPGGNINRVLSSQPGQVQWSNLPAEAVAANVIMDIRGLAVDDQGNLYISSYADTAKLGNYVARCTQAGTCTVLAGSGVPPVRKAFGIGGSTGDGGPGAAAQVAQAHGLTRDSQGNLYFADYRRIRRINAAGTIATVAGSTAAALFGDGRPVSELVFDPFALARDRQGNMYLADWDGHRVWKIGSDGVARVFAGTGIPGYSGDGGPAVAADLSEIASIAVDPAGNVYLGDTDLRRVRVVRPNGIIEAYAGVDWAVCNRAENNGKQASQMCLYEIRFMAADSTGNLYIGGDIAPYKITPQRVVQVLTAQLTESLGAVVVDGQDNTYWVVGGSQAEVRKMTPAGVVSRIAGTGTPGTSGDGGAATAAQVQVSELAIDRDGRLYLVDLDNWRLRMVDRDGLIHHLGGITTGTRYPQNLGLPAKNAFLAPRGITVDEARNIYLGVVSPGVLLRLEPAVVCRRCVTNAANYVGGKVAPGVLLTIFPMTPFGPPQMASYQLLDGGKQFATTVANMRVLFDGVPSPILYAWANQTSVAAPYSIAGKNTVEMVMEYNGQRTPPTRLQVAPAVPGIFTLNQSGKGQAAALNWPSYAVNGPQNKIAKGGILMLFGTLGGGQGQDGRVVEEIVPYPLPLQILIDNIPATVLYAGSAPGLISGMFQANVEVPANARSGDCIRIVLRLGPGWDSEEGFRPDEFACIAIQ